LAIGGGIFLWYVATSRPDHAPPPPAQTETPRSVLVTPIPVPVTPAPTVNSPTPANSITPPARPKPSPSPTLSAQTERDEIEAMVATQIETGNRGDVAESIALYANTVDFLDEGLISRDSIARDLPQYFARWPIRQGKRIGDITIEDLGSDEKRVGYTLDFEASNPATRERRQNTVNVTWVIRRESPRSPFKIVSHKQKSAKAEKAPAVSQPDGAAMTVMDYFKAVNNQDGRAAYRLFGRTYRNRVSFQEYLRRLKNTGTLTLDDIRPTAVTSNSATIEVVFQEVEPKGKRIRWHGPISLVVEDGEWRIDTLKDLKSDR
jgi:hypothetical protein